MVGWHHRLKGHDFEQAPGDGKGQCSLMFCSPWGRKESDDQATEQQQPTHANVSPLGSAFHFRPDLLCWASLLHDILQTSCSIMFFFSVTTIPFFVCFHLRCFLCDDSFQIKMPFHVAIWIFCILIEMDHYELTLFQSIFSIEQHGN